MAVDPRVAFGIEAPERIDVLGSLSRAAQVQNYLAQAQERQARADAVARKQRDEENLRGTVEMFGGDIEKALPEINKRDPITGISVQTKLAEMRAREQQAEAAKIKGEADRFDLTAKKAARLGALAGSIKDDATKDFAIGQAIREGLLPEEHGVKLLTRAYDDALKGELEQFTAQALTAQQQAEAARNKILDQLKIDQEKREAELHPGKVRQQTAQAISAEQKAAGTEPIQPAEQARLDAQSAAQRTAERFRQEQLALTKRGQDIALRGQDLTDKRARELNEINRVNKPPTAAERRALTYFERAANAAEALDAMESDMAGKGLFGQAWYSLAPNVLQSTDNQKYRQAQRAFTEARLRKDSGATIKDDEYAADAKTYFPQPGDSKAVLEQKKKGRDAILRSLYQEAGRAAQELNLSPPRESGGPKPGTIEDGYRFKGGNPADPASWEKVN